MLNKKTFVGLFLSLTFLLSNHAVFGEVVKIGKSGNRYVYKVHDVFVTLSVGDMIDGCEVTKKGLLCGKAIKKPVIVDESNFFPESKKLLKKKEAELKNRRSKIDDLSARLKKSEALLKERKKTDHKLERQKAINNEYYNEIEKLKNDRWSRLKQIGLYRETIESQQQTIEKLYDDYKKPAKKVIPQNEIKEEKQELPEIENTKTMTLLFDSSSYELRKNDEGYLNQHAGILKKAVSIDITGYADQTGSREFNEILTMQRVDEVFYFLKGMNVDEKVITKHTSVSPVIRDSGGRQENRRVEIVVKYELFSRQIEKKKKIEGKIVERKKDVKQPAKKTVQNIKLPMNKIKNEAVSPKIKTNLLTVHFDSSSYELKKNDAVYLNQYSDLFEKAVLIDIAGYTDHTGSMELNKKLSFQRTNAIYNYLKEKMNVNENVLIKRGGGSFGKPLNGGKEVNRRVEIEIYIKDEDKKAS